MTPAVAVVGGGAVGVTVSRDLASWGVDVSLYERDEIGAGASGRAAGVVYDAYAEDIDAALGRRSVERFRAVAARTDAPIQPCPYVVCARTGDDARVEAIRGAAERMRTHGLAVETVSGEALADRFPHVRGGDIAVAAVATDGAFVDTAGYTATVARLAREAGVEIHTDTPVRLTEGPGVEPSADGGGTPTDRSFDAVIVAAGAHTPSLLERIGAGVAVTPYRVQALTARLDRTRSVSDSPMAADEQPVYDEPMVYDATSGVYVRPHPTGLLAGDGTVPEPADPETYDRTADDWFRTDALAAVTDRLGFQPTVERSWAGVCTATPDGDPMVGRLRAGLYVAAGWQGHGFMRSPAHAELLATLVARDLDLPADSRPSIEAVAGGQTALTAFDPTRHAPDTQFEIREGMAVDE